MIQTIFLGWIKLFGCRTQGPRQILRLLVSHRSGSWMPWASSSQTLASDPKMRCGWHGAKQNRLDHGVFLPQEGPARFEFGASAVSSAGAPAESCYEQGAKTSRDLLASFNSPPQPLAFPQPIAEPRLPISHLPGLPSSRVFSISHRPPSSWTRISSQHKWLLWS